MLKMFSILIVSLLLSPKVHAQWELDNSQSVISFVSVKSNKIGEVNSFKDINGVIDDKGKMTLDVMLGSVETHIPIRNERIKSMLFKVDSFSKARISSALNLEKFKKLRVGEFYSDSVKLNLSLHSFANQVVAEVRVVKLSKKRFLATSIKPIVINASDYDLVTGIEKLRAVAKLPSISSAVPVIFNLVFFDSDPK